MPRTRRSVGYVNPKFRTQPTNNDHQQLPPGPTSRAKFDIWSALGFWFTDVSTIVDFVTGKRKLSAHVRIWCIAVPVVIIAIDLLFTKGQLISGVLFLALLAIIPALYFLPTIQAYKRNHRNKDSIRMLNFLLGWTFIGWVVSYVWASSKDVQQTGKGIESQGTDRQGNMRRCPFCAELIQAAAVVCKHCKSSVQQT